METLKIMLINLENFFLGFVKGLLIVLLSSLASVWNAAAPAYFFRDEFACSDIENSPSPLLVPVPFQFSVEPTKGQIPVLRCGDILKRLGSHDQDSKRCSVCLTCMKECDEVREIRSCFHVFHRECLNAWIDKGKITCPLCRSNMLSREKFNCEGDPWRRERIIYLFGKSTNGSYKRGMQILFFEILTPASKPPSPISSNVLSSSLFSGPQISSSMGFLDSINKISTKCTSARTLRDLLIPLKHFFMAFFFSKLFPVYKLYSDEQNPDSFFSEYRPSPRLVPVPIHLINNTIKEQLAVEEYSCLVERLNKEDQEDSCAVCFEKLEASHKIRELQNCRHLFHKKCLDAWIDKGRATCPLCRAKLLADHEESSKSTGDPWRSERMVYLFGEDYLICSAG